MASILKVNTIQDATNSTTAMTIDSSGRILTPARPSFQYDIQNYSGGTNKLSSPYEFGQQNDCDIDIAYMSPIPFINEITSDGFTTNIGSGASFVDHPVSSSYKYLKFTAPIAGLYCFGMVAHFINQHTGDDYMGFGLNKNRVNNVAAGSTINSTFDKPLVQAEASTGTSNNMSGTNMMDLALNDYVVFHCRSVEEARFNQSSMSFFGYLIG